jgi:RNA polymerase sigma factor (sigma-70 family)
MDTITHQEWRAAQDRARKLARNVIRRFPKYQDQLEDLVSEFHLCAVRAAEQFDRSQGVRFTTFAGSFMALAARDWLRRRHRPRRFNLSGRNWVDVVTVSFESQHGHSTLVDHIADPHNFVDELCDRAEAEERQQRVRAALGEIPERERHILLENFGRGRTLKSIGQDLGISESRAHQLKCQGLNRIKEVVN